MVLQLIKPTQQIRSVFRGGDIRIKLEKYPRVMRQIIKNIQNMPINIIKPLAQIHDIETKKRIREARFNSKSNAKQILISNLEIADNKIDTIKIISFSEITPFFESGVSPHTVFPNMQSVSGRNVSDWLEENGLPQTKFIVGGPNSSQKKPGIQFMKGGFEKSDREAPRITDRVINQI